MLTYTFEKREKGSLYEQLYRFIRGDILSGRLQAGEKLPSKRTLAQHLEVSIITVKNAYEQLLAEGYIHARQRCGYFVSEVERPPESRQAAPAVPAETAKEQGWFLDFASGAMDPAYFPFTVWARLMRQTILEQDKELLRAAPYNGAAELRVAIAGYLRQFRGMQVDPEQIIVGAGTELLYHLLIQLLGRDKCYAVEEPGYSKIAAIYESNLVQVQYIGIDEAGLSVSELRRHTAQVVHISPTHHYPTGTVMPIGRRQELLRWARQRDGFIIEDDYDSEFRFSGRPIPTLQSIDREGRVIYMNTFSQTISPSVRVGFMVLPPRLLERYRRELDFYACTVPALEQHVLARFLDGGHYEQHLSRMRKEYRTRRAAVLDAFRTSPFARRITISEQGAGLHFLLRLDTAQSDEALRRRAEASGVRLGFLSEYAAIPRPGHAHTLVVNYASLDADRLPEAMALLAEVFAE